MLGQRFGTRCWSNRHGRSTLVLDEQVLAAMNRRLDRFVDDEIPIEPDAVQTLRDFLERLRSELAGG